MDLKSILSSTLHDTQSRSGLRSHR